MFCMNCGKKMNEGAMFCPNCGTPVQSAQSAPAAQQAAPAQPVYTAPAAAPAAPVKTKKKHPILVIFILLFIGLCIFTAVKTSKDAAEKRAQKLTTRDCGSFTIGLPDGMEFNSDGTEAKNDSFYFEWDIIGSNDMGMTVNELTDKWAEDFAERSDVSELTHKDNTAKFVYQDKMGVKRYQVCRFYIVGDDIYYLTVVGSKSSESLMIKMLDSVDFK